MEKTIPSLKPKEILVLGFGGHGRELASFIQKNEASVRLFGFADDDKKKKDQNFQGAQVLGTLEDIVPILKKRKTPLYYLTAFGDNATRFKMIERVQPFKDVLLPYTFQHPQAYLGHGITLGQGTVVFPGSVLTVHVSVGDHCIVNTRVSLSHDVSVGRFSNINPGATLCGNVTLGEFCYIGAGATVIDKVSIGPGTVVGAGATVVDSLPAQVLAVGTPAKIIRKLD